MAKVKIKRRAMRKKNGKSKGTFKKTVVKKG